MGHVEISFWDYWDFPRMFVTRWQGKLLFFHCHFNEDREDYEDYFAVYELPPTLAEHLSDRCWPSLASLGSEGRLVGRVSVKEVTFPFRLKNWESNEERIAAIHESGAKAFPTGWMDDEVFKNLGLD